jgi:hypothetical protein
LSAALGLLLIVGGSGPHLSAAAASQAPAVSRTVPSSPADSITLTSPNNTRVAEADDYATQVLGNPWDMSDPDDTDYLDHLTPPTWNNGIWASTSTGDAPGIFLQYQRVPGSLIYNTEPSGDNYPIQPSRFTHFLVRMYSSVAGNLLVLWSRNTSTGYAGWSRLVPVQTGWHVYDVDLTQGSSGEAWASSNWNQIFFKPLFGGGTRANLQIDWARIASAAGSNVAINWTATGTNTVSLYLDSDQNAGNGTDLLIASGLNPASGGYTWNAGGVAPGTYYVRAVMGTASAYSGPLIVNNAPVLEVTAPGTASGEDYATAVLNLPWTMTYPSNLQTWYNVANHQFTNSFFTGNGNGDPQLWYLNNDTAHAIDTNKYHYFNTWLYLAQPNAPPENGQYYQWNGGPRVIWSPGVPLNWQSTQLWLGWYNRWENVGLDLRTAPREPGGNVGWAGGVSIFRFDPHEEAGPAGSSIYPAFLRVGMTRLTADPAALNAGATTIEWLPGKTSGTVALSYSANRGGPWTSIVTGLPITAGGYVWTPSGLANGNYWVRAVASDGFNTFTRVSNTALKITGTRPCPSQFSDAGPGTPFYTYISDLYCRNVVEGYSDNTFRPNMNAWRGTLAKWVVLARGWPLDSTGAPHFIDVPTSDPLYPYIETAFNHGVISGYSDGTFRPYNNVTRGQMSKMVVNAMGWAINTSGGPHFSDVPTSNAFYQWIETIYNRGIVSGYSDGTFRWGNDLTRGQLSKVLSNAIASP